MRSPLAAMLLAAVAAQGPARAEEANLPRGFAPPRLVERVEPRYPEQARREGAVGTVLVLMVVDRDGKVSEAKIARGAGHGFDEAALEAARALRFEPATQDGTPISVQLNYEIHFQLTPELPTLRDVATPRPAGGDAPRAEPAGAATRGFESVVEGEKPFTSASA